MAPTGRVDLTPEHLKVRPSWGKRLAGIEGLRGVAALSVIVTHVGAEMAEAQMQGENRVGVAARFSRHGLTLFFVLSGFLLFRPFAGAILDGTVAPNVRRFFRNRALRIGPAYIVILLFTSIVLGVARLPGADPLSHFETSGRLSPPDLLLSLTFLQTLIPYGVRAGLGVAWSLTTEVTFYLLLPVLGWIGLRSLRFVRSTTAALVPVAVLFIIGITGKVWLAAELQDLSLESDRYVVQWGHTWTAVIVRSILTHADLFAWGMLAAVVALLLERRATDARPYRLVRATAVITFLTALLASRGAPYPWVDTAVAAASAAVVLLVLLPTRKDTENSLARLLDWAPVRFVGLISYGVYLWHIPVIWSLQKRDWAAADTLGGYASNLVVVTVITIALSTITYYGVERPAMSRRERTGPTEAPRRKRRFTLSPSTASINT